MGLTPLFAPWPQFPGRYIDPYEAINDRFFADVFANGDWSALPAGWLNPALDHGYRWEPPHLTYDDAVPFLLDLGNALGVRKAKVATLLSAVEGAQVSPDEFTLCSSTTQANFIALVALRRMGISRIVIDCPAYYGTVDQAEELGFEIVLVQQTVEGSLQGQHALLDCAPSLFEGAAVWITQPRFAVGVNWAPATLQSLLKKLSSSSILVVDEAADQTVGTTDFRMLLRAAAARIKIIRTKGLFKGIGLNGLRLSAIAHSRSCRQLISECLDTVGGSLDSYSLQSAIRLADNPAQYKMLVNCASLQVKNRRKLAETAALGTNIVVAPLENSYIGSLFFPLRGEGGWPERTEEFLQKCSDLRFPVVVGDSMYYFPGGTYGAIRLNYFTSEENILNSVRMLQRVI